MTVEGPDGTPLDGCNALMVRTTDDNDKVGVGIYNVPPADKRPADVPEGQLFAKFLAGVRLEPEQAYEIAQLLTRTAMKVEDARKARE